MPVENNHKRRPVNIDEPNNHKRKRWITNEPNNRIEKKAKNTLTKSEKHKMKKKQKNMAKNKDNANDEILKTKLSSEMPGTFPLPSPPTTPTMIVLDSDDDDKEDNNNDDSPKKAIDEENQVIYTTTNKISLTDRDLQTLQPGKWLNDTIIDFSLKMIQDRNHYNDHSFVSSSFFFTRLRLAKE